jgi:UDP-glucuronate 4-epimerase
MKILVTGAAGFIGFHLALQLLQRGDQVVGLDNLNNYYDVNLKQARLERLQKFPNFTFIKCDLADKEAINTLFAAHSFDKVVNLAAQAGVRYSIENPRVYVDANIVGFLNILEACKAAKVAHLIYASSSSVYGNNSKAPFSEDEPCIEPASFYAATKKANELMAYSYASVHQLPCTGLRFFTVYGPWGRPDMALFTFTANILADKPIDIYNGGDSLRDFTYIDDVVKALLCMIDKPQIQHDAVPHEIYNIGHNQPVQLLSMIELLENKLQKKAIKNFLPPQPADVLMTCANIEKLKQDFACEPTTHLTDGMDRFIQWYKDYFKG